MLQAIVKDYAGYTLEGVCIDDLEFSYNYEYEKFERKGYVEFLLSREVDYEGDEVDIDFENLLYSFDEDNLDYKCRKYYKW